MTVSSNRLCSDVLILGGGVTGLTTAYRLAEQGSAVTLVDRCRVGREASWAGAGMLPPGNLLRAATPEARLRAYSHSLWPDLTSALREETGMDNEYRACGSLDLADPAEVGSLASLSQQLSDEGVMFWHVAGREDLQKFASSLNPDIEHAIFVPEFCQVRNPRHLKALTVACRYRDVTILEQVDDLALQRSGHSVSVHGGGYEFQADQILIAAGAWSSKLLASLGVRIPVTPVRGQMLQLQCDRLPFQCLIQQGRRYLVPRADGLMLVGSTEEDCGFDKRTTAEAIHDLLAFAIAICPELRSASVARTWAGLRPGSPDELPLLGRVADFDNLFVAAGHFRSGLQMSVGTASVMTDLLLNRQPQISLAGLEPNRFDLTATSPGRT